MSAAHVRRDLGNGRFGLRAALPLSVAAGVNL